MAIADVTGRRALIVVAKAPEPGRTKTRLCPPLSFEAAARLYRAFLLDTAETALALGWERVTLVHPNDAHVGRALAELIPRAASLQPQRGSGLGNALSSAFDAHFSAGFSRVVLIGSDSPSLPSTFIDAACAALDRSDLVLGPSADGGYYLIGMRAFHPSLFYAINWSTDRVYEQTLDRARALRLGIWSLPEWYDVDTESDLRRLVADVHTLPNHVARQTRALLSELQPSMIAYGVSAPGG